MVWPQRDDLSGAKISHAGLLGDFKHFKKGLCQNILAAFDECLPLGVTERSEAHGGTADVFLSHSEPST